MPIDIKIKNRIAKVEILEKEGSLYTVLIDGKKYTIDVTKVEDGVYSIIHKKKSINMEMIEGDSPRLYNVNTRNNNYNIEIIDAQAKYRKAGKHIHKNDETIISSPMPGKIVSINVKPGQSIKMGETVITISAMKMESEYKSPFDGVVTNVFVKENETIEGNEALVEISPSKTK
jgi:biotin carboxyl carrier protein